jgi:hypothetical protein
MITTSARGTACHTVPGAETAITGFRGTLGDAPAVMIAGHATRCMSLPA